MSEIRQVGPNHWVGPEDFGITPNFYITQHGVEHYPNGHLMQQEPLHPGNKKITLVHETTEPDEDLITKEEKAELDRQVAEFVKDIKPNMFLDETSIDLF